MVDAASEGSAVQVSGKTLVNSRVPAGGCVVQESVKTLASRWCQQFFNWRILEFSKHRSICLGNLRGPSSLGAVFTEFHLIRIWPWATSMW